MHRGRLEIGVCSGKAEIPCTFPHWWSSWHELVLDSEECIDHICILSTPRISTKAWVTLKSHIFQLQPILPNISVSHNDVSAGPGLVLLSMIGTNPVEANWSQLVFPLCSGRRIGLIVTKDISVLPINVSFQFYYILLKFPRAVITIQIFREGRHILYWELIWFIVRDACVQNVNGYYLQQVKMLSPLL